MAAVCGFVTCVNLIFTFASSVVHLRIFSQRDVRTCKPRVGSKANTLIFLEMSDGSGSAKDQRENEPRPAIAPVMSDLRCELPGTNISDYLSNFLNRLHLGTLYTGFNLPVSRSKVASRLLSPSPAPTVHQVTCFCWCVCVMFWMFW